MCSLNIGAQVGSCEKEISIQDDKMAGSLVKPKASVNYYEESGNGIYGLIITQRTETDLSINKGHKVSIEFTDSSREVVEIEEVEIGVYPRPPFLDLAETNILVYPNFENLITKEINRIVIQQANGEMYIVNTNPKKAKKLPGEFKKAMQEAVDSYRSKVSNDSYFE